MPRADKKFTRKFKKLAKAKFMPFNLSRVAKSRENIGQSREFTGEFYYLQILRTWSPKSKNRK